MTWAVSLEAASSLCWSHLEESPGWGALKKVTFVLGYTLSKDGLEVCPQGTVGGSVRLGA